MYVLEDGYRWLTGLDKSFWSAPFFYPAPNVIAYSDNHLGSLLFYSAFRLLGQGRETAFQLWVVTIFTLNYIGLDAALSRNFTTSESSNTLTTRSRPYLEFPVRRG